MNFHQQRRFSSNLTSKGQVTIPKEIRDALGLKPGDRVAFELDDDGNARVRPVDRDAELARREAEIVRGVQEARRAFKAAGGLPDGMTNDEWYALMRGPPAES